MGTANCYNFTEFEWCPVPGLPVIECKRPAL